MPNRKQELHGDIIANFSPSSLEVSVTPTHPTILSYKTAKVAKELSTQLGPISTDLFIKIVAEVIRSEPPIMPIKVVSRAKVRDSSGKLRSLDHKANSIAVPKPD